MGTFSKLGATVVKETFAPAVFVDVKCVTKVSSTAAAMPKYAVTKRIVLR